MFNTPPPWIRFSGHPSIHEEPLVTQQMFRDLEPYMCAGWFHRVLQGMCQNLLMGAKIQSKPYIERQVSSQNPRAFMRFYQDFRYNLDCYGAAAVRITASPHGVNCEILNIRDLGLDKPHTTFIPTTEDKEQEMKKELQVGETYKKDGYGSDDVKIIDKTQEGKLFIGEDTDGDLSLHYKDGRAADGNYDLIVKEPFQLEHNKYYMTKSGDIVQMTAEQLEIIWGRRSDFVGDDGNYYNREGVRVLKDYRSDDIDPDVDLEVKSKYINVYDTGKVGGERTYDSEERAKQMRDTSTLCGRKYVDTKAIPVLVNKATGKVVKVL